MNTESLTKAEKYRIWRTQNVEVYKANQAKQNEKRKERNRQRKLERLLQQVKQLEEELNGEVARVF